MSDDEDYQFDAFDDGSSRTRATLARSFARRKRSKRSG